MTGLSTLILIHVTLVNSHAASQPAHAAAKNQTPRDNQVLSTFLLKDWLANSCEATAQHAGLSLLTSETRSLKPASKARTLLQAFAPAANTNFSPSP